jgi:hypothetical protein
MHVGNYLHVPGQEGFPLALCQHHDYLAMEPAEANDQTLKQSLSGKNKRTFILLEAGAVAARQND